MQETKKPLFSTGNICRVALLAAMGAILLKLEFPIFPATPYLKMNFGDFPGLIAGFMLGPLLGCLTQILRVIIFFFIFGTSTGGVGELSNIIGGIMMVLPAALIYKHHRCLKGAFVGMLIGAFCNILSMCAFNLFVFFPMFMPANTFATNVKIVFTWVLAFNTVRCVCNALLTFLLYKRLRKIIE